MKINKDGPAATLYKKVIPIVKLVILLGLVIGVPVIIYLYFPDLIQHFRSLDDINHFLDRNQTASIFIYMGLQVIQIVISFIPGQPLQFAAGYAFNFWFGYLYSIIGVGIGSIITFSLARLLGKDAMSIIFGEERFSRFVHLLNTKKALTVLFILFLIPGLPKDLLAYAAGVSDIRIKSFLAISLIGRTPAMMGSIMMGRMFYTGSYIGLIILGALAIILFVVMFLNRRKIMNWSDRAYGRLTRGR